MKLSRREFIHLLPYFSTLPVIGCSEPSGKERALQKAKSEEPCFVQICLYGSPVRWSFDLPLKLNENDPFSPNFQVANGFNEKNEPTYIVDRYQKYFLPHLWSQPVPGVRKDRFGKELLENTHMVRGVFARSPGHPQAGRQLNSYGEGGHSISGLIAEKSKFLLQSVSFGDTPVTRAFQSPGKASTIIVPDQAENYIEFLLKSFVKPDANWLSPSAVKAVQDFVGEHQDLEHIAKKKYEELLKDYSTTLKKYERLSQQAIQEYKYKNLTDRKIPALVNYASQFSKNQFEKQESSFYLFNKYMAVNEDLTQAFNESRSHEWPKNFAAAEVLLRHGITKNIVLGPAMNRGAYLENVAFKGIPRESFAEVSEKIQLKDKKVAIESLPSTLVFDSHSHPNYPYILASGLFFYSLTSMLVEFVDTLKRTQMSPSKSLFDKTLIQITAEFGRLPNSDKKPESDHNLDSHNSTFISGAINNFHVSGNILSEKRGTYGNGADNPKLGLLSLGNVLNGVSDFFGVDRLDGQAKPIFAVQAGKIKPTLPMGKNIKANS